MENWEKICPLSMSCPTSLFPCQKQRCAWWDEDSRDCAAAVLARAIKKRLLELAEADKAGRLVVLPCKAGDELWTFCNYPYEQVHSFTVTDISTLNGRTMLNTSRCGVIDARDVGKTVFLTREEAVEALEAWRR